MHLDYSRPKNHAYEVAAANLVMRLIHSVRPPARPLGNSPTIQHHTYIELEPYEAMSLDRLAEATSEIVGMCAILYGGHLLSRSVTQFRGGRGDGKALFFYPRHAVKSRSYKKSDFAIRYEHIKASFGEILEGWLGASETIKQSRRIFLSTERTPSEFIEFRFLPLVHAAEILSLRQNL